MMLAASLDPLIIPHGDKKVNHKPSGSHKPSVPLNSSRSPKPSKSLNPLNDPKLPIPQNLKIALVCDWLTDIGGAERVLKSLSELFPDAPIYTSQYRPRRIDWFKKRTVKTGWLNYFPAPLRRFIGPLRQLYFSHLDLTAYDLVISVTGAEAKSVKAKKHLCYCHVPTQYYWQLYQDYLKNPGFGPLSPLARFGLKLLVGPLRRADFGAAKKPDQFITISNYAAAAIKRYYHRDAIIVHPPVAVEKFSQVAPVMPPSPDRPLHLINFSRQVSWKRLDLAIKACLITDTRLTLIGDGPEHHELVRLANSSSQIKFIPTLPQSELLEHLAAADAFIFPSLEPFGIAPVEALAAGRPVLAYGKGGAVDYVNPGVNGVLFDHQKVKSLALAITSFRKHHFNSDKIKSSALSYSEANFQQGIIAAISDLFSSAR